MVEELQSEAVLLQSDTSAKRAELHRAAMIVTRGAVHRVGDAPQVDLVGEEVLTEGVLGPEPTRFQLRARVQGRASVVLSHLSPGLTNCATGVANAALE